MNSQVGNGDHAGRAEKTKERSAFWVSPPRRFAVNRHGPRAVPQNLSVVVALDPRAVEPNAFFQSIPPLTQKKEGGGPLCNNAAVSPDHGCVDDQDIPPFFKVQVYVWEDTTMREVFEEVLTLCAAARRVLLPAIVAPNATATAGGEAGEKKDTAQTLRAQPDDEEEGEGENDKHDVAKDAEPDVEENGECEMDDESVSLDGDDGDEAPASKRGRTEAGDDTEPRARSLPTAQKRRRRRRRLSLMPTAKVRFYHVFAGAGNRPQIRDITTLRVDKPIFYPGDYITMQQLRTSKSGGRGWKNGDVLVMTPTVRHWQPASVGDAAA